MFLKLFIVYDLMIRRYQTILLIKSEVFGFRYKLSFWDISRADEQVDNVLVKKAKLLDTNDPNLIHAKGREIKLEYQSLVAACQQADEVHASFLLGREYYYLHGYLVKGIGNIYRVFPEVAPFATYRIFVDVGWSNIDIIYIPNIQNPKIGIVIYSTGDAREALGRPCAIRYDTILGRLENFILLRLMQDSTTKSKPFPVNLEIVSGRLVKESVEAEIPIFKFVPGYRREIVEQVESGAKALTYFELYNIPVMREDIENLVAGGRYYRNICERLVRRMEEIREHLIRMQQEKYRVEVARMLKLVEDTVKAIAEEIEIIPILRRLGRETEERR